MSATATLEVSVSAGQEIPRRDVDEARRRMATLATYTSQPLSDARCVLRRGGPHATRPFIADTSIRLAGRLLAAHATGATASEAAELAVDRLRRQLLRVAEVAKEHRGAVLVRQAAQLVVEQGLQVMPEFAVDYFGFGHRAHLPLARAERRRGCKPLRRRDLGQASARRRRGRLA